MKKENFFIVYLEDSKTGKRIDCGDLVNSRLTWTFYDLDEADDFAALLSSYIDSRYITCLAECSPSESTLYKVK